MFNIKGFMVMMVAVLLAGCASPASTQPEKQTEVTIAAAASLQGALTEIGDMYEKSNPQVKLTFIFAGSGTLQKQIEEGAAVDVFISAGKKQMKALDEKGMLVKDTQRNLLSNSLVLIVQTDADTPEDLAGLSDPSFKAIALGNPDSVPAGTYSKEALTEAGLYDSLSGRMVQGKDVKEVLTWVETGNAEAGFVYQSDAKNSKKVKVAFEVDSSLHSPILYPAALIKDRPASEAAGAFMEYLISAEAESLFKAHGFTAVK